LFLNLNNRVDTKINSYIIFEAGKSLAQFDYLEETFNLLE
jgi:hypothetical protein